jgi:hypothetical protein
MACMTWPFGLNVVTGSFAENRTQGLMLCGYEWGGSPDEPSTAEKPGFFSQAGINEYRYRSQLLGWFELFGHRLETDPLKAGRFERSILQTNWLPTQAKSMAGRDPFAECVATWTNFEFHLRELQPRVIVFLGVALLRALNSSSCIDGAQQVLGKCQTPIFMQKSVVDEGHSLRPLKLGFQEFESADVIALPHPASHGVANKYLLAFKSEVGTRLHRYKMLRGSDP